MKVLIADKFEKVGIDGLKELGCTVVSKPDTKAEQLPALIRETDPHILIVRGTKVNADALKAGTALTLVIRAGAGIDTIDVATASSLGVFVSAGSGGLDLEASGCGAASRAEPFAKSSFHEPITGKFVVREIGYSYRANQPIYFYEGPRAFGRAVCPIHTRRSARIFTSTCGWAPNCPCRTAAKPCCICSSGCRKCFRP